MRKIRLYLFKGMKVVNLIQPLQRDASPALIGHRCGLTHHLVISLKLSFLESLLRGQSLSPDFGQPLVHTLTDCAHMRGLEAPGS